MPIFRTVPGVAGAVLLAAPLLFALGCDSAGEGEAPQSPVATLAESSGRVVVGRAPAAVGGFASVVSLEPTTETDFAPPAGPAWVGQYGTQFSPPVLVTRVSQPVEFSNDEDVVHNVHAIAGGGSGDTVFNVTTFQGTPYRYAFEVPGVYRLSCGVHPAMLAFVVVSPSPYATLADDAGEFRFEDVPPGAYDLVVWNADLPEPIRSRIEIGGVETDLGEVGR